MGTQAPVGRAAVLITAATCTARWSISVSTLVAAISDEHGRCFGIDDFDTGGASAGGGGGVVTSHEM